MSKPRAKWVTNEPRLQLTMSRRHANKLHALLSNVGGCREVYELISALNYGDDEHMFDEYFEIVRDGDSRNGDLIIRPIEEGV